MNLLDDLVEYEISGSWWAGWLPFGHKWIGSYMIWKTRRKINRYKRFLEMRKRIELLKSIYDKPQSL